MSATASQHYDIAIVGAGPVGSLCALAHARNGARVALLEANPKGSGRLAGEWLHPSAARVLRDIGMDADQLPRSKPGKGFVVFPEDGSEPILLPYPDGSRGLVCDHALLVSSLRDAVGNAAGVDFIPYARVKAVDDERVFFSANGAERSLVAGRIVGADGRASIVRRSLGLSTEPMLCSRMLGVTIRGAKLPFESYGHLVLGGPGPIFVYGLADGCIRVIVDIPPDLWKSKGRNGFLSESFARFLPGGLERVFIEALQAGQFQMAANQLRPRITYGSPRRVLIGDAAGHYHPMTAVGMTLGFGDAVALAGTTDFRDFVAERFQASRVPELLAIGLYEVFADRRTEATALRFAIYRGWRTNPTYRNRTTRILACEDLSVTGMSLAICRTVAWAVAGEMSQSFRPFSLRRARTVCHALAIRLWWLLRGVRQLQKARRGEGKEHEQTRDILARTFPHSMSSGASGSHPPHRSTRCKSGI